MPGSFAEIVSTEIARAECRALVPVGDDTPAHALDLFAGLRANFLAHLIATRDRLPQTTALRRETPEVAVFAYAHPRQEFVRPQSRLV